MNQAISYYKCALANLFMLKFTLKNSEFMKSSTYSFTALLIHQPEK